MARSKRKKNRKVATGSAKPTAHSLLEEAKTALRTHDLPRSLRAARQAETLTDSAPLKSAARHYVAEVLFRSAMKQTGLARLETLQTALQETPADPRLHFYCGIEQLRLQNAKAALLSLQTAAAKEPNRPGLTYFMQLARLANGQKWSSQGLAPEEENTLLSVAALSRPAGASPGSISGPSLGDTEMWRELLAIHAEGPTTPVRDRSEPKSSVQRYYQGVAMLREGKSEQAFSLWQNLSLAYLGPWAAQNWTYALRERAVALADQQAWRELASMASPSVIEDRILAETVGAALFHIGYDAVQAADWSAGIDAWTRAESYISSRHLAQNRALALEALEEWSDAGEAWREMVRRRPRSQKHPDYLTDEQTAALWEHAADCYAREQEFDMSEERITCLRNALKYASNSADLRFKLADTLDDEGRSEAAINELQRLLEVDPNHLPGLLLLAHLYESDWRYPTVPVWERILAIDPNHAEARDGLARHYLARLERFRYLGPQIRIQGGNSPEQILLQGLAAVPGHPELLVALARLYTDDEPEKARAYLRQAYQGAGRDLDALAEIFHEMLHVEDDQEITQRISEISLIPNLAPGFWFSQIENLLQCELAASWIPSLTDAALRLIDPQHTEWTPASVLLQVYEIIEDSYASAECRALKERIQTEHGQSGALEYIAAYEKSEAGGTPKQVTSLLQKALRQARKSGDTGVAQMAESRIQILTNPRAGLLSQLTRGGMPDSDQLERILFEMLGQFGDDDEFPDLF